MARFIGGEAESRRAALSRPAGRAREILRAPLPKRPPAFCTGCPERPVFSALKIAQRELGETHVAADIGCHAFATLPPFNMGNTILGYGMGLASASAVAPAFGHASCPSWATAASGTRASPRASPMPSSISRTPSS